MTNRAKAKGTAFESLVRDYFRRAGVAAERMPAGAREDRGDLAGVTDWTLECKSYADMGRAVRDGLADLEREQGYAGSRYGAVIYKRRGHTDPGRQLVVMELWQFKVAFVQAQQESRR